MVCALASKAGSHWWNRALAKNRARRQHGREVEQRDPEFPGFATELQQVRYLAAFAGISGRLASSSLLSNWSRHSSWSLPHRAEVFLRRKFRAPQSDGARRRW